MVKNLITRSITTLCLLLTGCADAMTKNKTEFEWVATESATDLYPMKIVQGSFYYQNSNNGVSIPSGGAYVGEWGDFISTHVGGDDIRPLPDRMDILFYSLAEKQFYKGQFDLPYETILALFREGVAADKKRPWYRRIMVGTAPGGVVAVWVTGSRTKEVFFGKAEKYDLSYGRAIGIKFDSPQEESEWVDDLIRDMLKPEQLAAIKRDGIPFNKWERYRKLYKWTLTSAGPLGAAVKHRDIGCTFLNGENQPVAFPFSKEFSDAQKPLPRRISLSVIKNNLSYPYVVNFDEFEIMDTFEKLGAQGELVHIEVTPHVVREATTLRAYNSKESIELKKAKVPPKTAD